jgi:PAS domain S-box-containing protein
MAGDDDWTILFVAATDEQTRRLGRALENARSQFDVEWSSDTDEARDRLAWPDIDCLIVVPSPGQYDAVTFVETVRETHPMVPIVYYGDVDPTCDDEETTFVEAAGPDSIPDLADHVTDRLNQREQRRASYDFGDDAGAVKYPNVSESNLDELLDGEIDRAQLRELYHKSQLFDVILETLPAHLYVKDVNGRHLYISTAYFGDEMEEFLGQADPEIGIVASPHAFRAFEEDMHVIEENEPIVDKEEYLARLDQWNLTSKVPWQDADGETVGLIGVTRDITRWKRRERELRRQNERLAAFSELVSHDLRNPLQVARSALTLAQEACECNSDHLERVESAHKRMDEMVDDVLTLAKYGQTVIETEPMALEDSIAQAWGTVGDGRGTLTVAEGLGTVACDPNQLQRLLENLFRNALEHATDDGTVEVEVEPISRPWPNHPEEHPRHGFAVTDDGPGIPKEDRERVLEAGYTMAADGTGFGLAIVSEIVNAHGWTLEIGESAEGGARFEILDIGRTDDNSLLDEVRSAGSIPPSDPD